MTSRVDQAGSRGNRREPSGIQGDRVDRATEAEREEVDEETTSGSGAARFALAVGALAVACGGDEATETTAAPSGDHGRTEQRHHGGAEQRHYRCAQQRHYGRIWRSEDPQDRA